MPMLRYMDVVLISAAAPILLLMGVPAVGYGVGAGAWFLVRLIGAATERYAATGSANQALTIRLVFMISRLFLLALTVVLVRQGSGRDAGLTALLVIVFAFSVALATEMLTRP